jgi:hypothetical protein
MPNGNGVSPRFSFKGFSLMVWLSKNAEWVKAFLAGETAALTASQWKIAIALGIGAVAKFCYDAIDYFITQAPLPPPTP